MTRTVSTIASRWAGLAWAVLQSTATKRQMMHWASAFALALSAYGCDSLLGLEERTLDTEAIDEEGYPGCIPEEGECGGCTTAWHQCLCEGWEDAEDTAIVRLDCADLAPVGVREEAREEALKAYTKWKEDQEEDSKQHELSADDDPSSNSSSDGDNGSADAGDAEKGSEPQASLEPSSSDIEFGEGFCEFEQPVDACQGCLCGECQANIEDCVADAGCTQVMACVFSGGCDPGKSCHCSAHRSKRGGFPSLQPLNGHPAHGRCACGGIRRDKCNGCEPA